MGEARPHPVRAALLGAVAVGLAVETITCWALWSTTRFFTSSSTAPIGMIFVPIWALENTAWGALFGAGLGYLLSGRSAGRRLREPAMAISGLVVLGVGAWATFQLAPQPFIGRKVRAVETMSEPELGHVLDQRLLGRNVHVLAAVAGNPNASGETLDRIARLPDPGLHESQPTVFDAVQGKNTRMRSVMRLVAGNPNVRPQTLELLGQTGNFPVLRDVASNPKATPSLLDWLARSEDRFTRWAVAKNPNTSQQTLDRLRTDANSEVSSAASRDGPRSPVPFRAQ